MKKILILTFVFLFLVGCSSTTQDLVDQTELEEEQDVILDEEQTDSFDDFNGDPVVTQRPNPTTPPISQPETPPNRQVLDSNIELTQPLALVESVEVLVLESYPPQYNAVITGNFRNGCESIGNSTQLVTGNLIEVAVGVQSEGEICTMALVPFKENISLETEGLSAGNYTLSVNGVTTQFNVQ
jgi:hypothetical protein